MIKKKFLLLAIIVVWVGNSKAQPEFLLNLTHPETDDVVYDTKELSDGTFLFVGRTFDWATSCKSPLLIKTDFNGNIESYKQYNFSPYSGDFFNIVEKSGQIYVVGDLIDTTNAGINRFFISELNSNYDTTSLHFFILPDSLDVTDAMSFVDSSGNFIIFGYLCNKLNIYQNNMFVYKINMNSKQTQFKLFNDIMFCYDMVERKERKGFYAFIFGRSEKNTNEMVRLDSSLNIQSFFSFDQILEGVHSSAKWFSDTTLICVSEIVHSNYPAPGVKRGITSIILNPEDTIISQTDIEVNDTLTFPACRDIISVNGDNSAYIGGIKNFDVNGGGGYWSTYKSWFSLTRLDKDLNIIWTKYYGGDAYYVLWTVKATSDGGCLLLGTRYDYLTQNEERDIFIIKVDENGNVTSVKDNPGIMAKEAILYPNPGANTLHIQTALKDATLEMYDANGRLVVQQNINETTSVNTSALNQGMYFYRIMQNGEVKDSGKWVKQQ